MVDVEGEPAVLKSVDNGPVRADYFSVMALKPVQATVVSAALTRQSELARLSAASMRERISVMIEA